MEASESVSMNHTQPEAADLLAAARRLGPLIRDRRDESERDRRLPARVLSAMHEARLFRMYVPVEYGGLETDPITSMQVVEAVAEADAATAWNLMIGATYGIWAAFLPEVGAREIYGNTDAVVAGGLRPSGIAHAAAGGYRVSGRWAFASGIDHCAWWNGGCVVYEDGAPRPTETGTPQTVLVFFPATGGERIDTWDTGGLRGTGSHDYAVRDLFVPAERAFAFDASPSVPGLLYRLPCQALLDNAMAAIPLGIARTAIDTLIELAATKRPGRSDQPLAERLTVQAEVGRAEALYRSGRAFLYDSVAESWAAVQAGRKIEITQLAMLRLARTHAVQAAVQAIDLMYTAAGGSSVYTHNLLERCFRDAHTVTQHVSMNPANYQASGRVILGLGSDRPLYRL
jgi:alkylation response protein AidB-like acyl-CoA dehydrogenase